MLSNGANDEWTPHELQRTGFSNFIEGTDLVAEAHSFTHGNGRLARLVMNAEPSAMGVCRIIVQTLFRDEYLDCLRVLTRDGNTTPFLDAMRHIHGWNAAFDCDDLDGVIAAVKSYDAFEEFRTRHEPPLPRPGLKARRPSAMKKMGATFRQRPFERSHQPFTHTTCFNVCTTSTRSRCASITASMSL